MRHAAHKAAKVSNRRFSVGEVFATSRGSHSVSQVYAVQAAQQDGAVVGLEEAVARKLNEIIPVTRRSMRESAKAAQRRSHLLASSSLAALVGTAATAVAFASPHDSSLSLANDPATTTTQMKRITSDVVSRSEDRTALPGESLTTETAQTTNNGNWSLGGSDSTLNVDMMSKASADNAVVANSMDTDTSALPQGFNPNHATGDTGNAYAFSQCTWWVYIRRHQLGLPVGSHMGNGNQWANSARALGYWVDNTPRHVGDVMVFAAGQADSDAAYGHVAIVEKINADGSIVTSEMGASYNGQTFSRTFPASETSAFQFIHY